MSEDITGAEQAKLALALTRLLESASEGLPKGTPPVEMAKRDRNVFHRAIASKISHGYQLEFVMMSGETHYGFVIGLDDLCVQIYSTGYGREFEKLSKEQSDKEIERNSVETPSRHWLMISQIESVNENFFGIKHMTPKAQDALNSERSAMINIAKRFLYGRGNR